MKDLDEIDLPYIELKHAIRYFLHVEWYETAALKEKIQSRTLGLDVEALRSQFHILLEGGDFPLTQLNELTDQDFESADQARKWLSSIYKEVF
jgi:hypothetical protein